MGESVTIVLPVPDRCLSPNAGYTGGRGGAFKKAKARKSLRESAHVETWKATYFQYQWSKASIKVCWYGRTKNILRMDQDNAIAMLKGAGDGLQDAGLIVNDNKLEWERPVVFKVDPDEPRVELTVTRMEE